MTWIPAKMPSFAKKFFPNYVWDFFSERRQTNEKVMYLTFDDGPLPNITEFVLDELQKYDAKATFFCIGSNVEKHPDVFKKLVLQGHSIGNHTQRHLIGWETPNDVYLADILEAEKAINSQISDSITTPVNLFRPPYGKISKQQGKILKERGYNIIMWDVIAKDWLESIKPKQCLQNIIKNAKNGSIVVLHDSIKASRNVHYVLPRLLEHFSKKGFKFEAIKL